MRTMPTWGRKAAAAAPRNKAAERLAIPFQVKAGSANDEQRTFQGLASTWDLDLGNDVIHRGAYARTLSHWKSSGRVIALVDSHGYESVCRVVGKMIEAEETAEGLLCTFQMLEAGDEAADAAWRRVKGGFVTSLSIGYRAVKYDFEQPEGTEYYWDRIRNLYEVELREVSLVLFPMNPEAQIDTGSAKSLASLADAIRAGALDDEAKQQLRALLDTPAQAPATEPPAEPEEKGLAPEDPKRLELESQLRDLTLRSLAASAARTE